MLKNIRLPSVLTLSLALMACSQSTPTSTTKAPGGAEKPVTKAAADNSVGIAECDDYLAKYETCLASKVPEAARATLLQSLNETRSAWRTAAGNAGAKDVLASTCKQSREAMKVTMAAYGCSDF